MTLAQRTARKYFAILGITMKNQLVYVWDFFIRSFFLIVLLYIFVQLWKTTYSATGSLTIGGLGIKEMIWYLIITESIFMAMPRLNERIEEEVKGGDIGYRLNRPISYLLYHYVTYMGEGAIRLAVNLVIGVVVGGVALQSFPFHTVNLVFASVLTVGAFTVNYVISMAISLSAFWMEETRGLQFVYNKFILALGGTLIPLDVFPSWLRTVSQWLPFQAISYLPAKAAVASDVSFLWAGVLTQLAWTILLAVVLSVIFRKGVRRIHVNGG